MYEYPKKIFFAKVNLQNGSMVHGQNQSYLKF